MRDIVFVSDLAVHDRREVYRAALRAIVDPILRHLPEARFADEPDPAALNVRMFTITLDAKYDVFLSHGIACKSWRMYSTIRDFEHIFTSGPTYTDRYVEQGCPPEKLWEAGYAKLDPLFNGEITRGNGPRILWAPTHPTSWPRHYDQLRSVIDVLPYKIAHSAHPQLTRKPTLQPLMDADVVIADGGSTLYEAWALGKPVVFPSWIVTKSRLLRPHSLERDIYARKVGRHAGSRESLVELIRDALNNGITDAERDFIEGVLPTRLRGTSGKAHADALRTIAKGDLARAA